jgi:hypothetical protein
MLSWIRARFAEPSTYGAFGGLCLAGCFYTLTFWSHWRWFGYAAAAFFIAQALKTETKG